MKSISQGIPSVRMRSAMKKTAPLRTPMSSISRPAYSAEIPSPNSTARAGSRSSSMRTSETPRSSSVCDTFDVHSFRLDDARHRDHVVPAHDERPRLACRPGDLRVDEHVLDLLRSPDEPITGAPGPYLKAWELRGNPPLPPAHLAVECDGRALEPDPVVLAHGGQAGAEVEPPRPGGRREQLVERRPLSLREPEQVALGGGMQLAQARQDLVPDETALRLAVGLVGPELEPFGTAVLLRLLAPDCEQRAHDAVLAARLDPFRNTTRDEPVQDRLDLVGGGVPGGAQMVGRERVPDPAPVVLGAPA